MPAVAAVMEPGVAADSRWLATAAGAASGDPERTAAAAPATCGVAMEVPLIEAMAVVEAVPADVIPTPGAYRSTQAPKLEKDAWRSDASLAATVSALGTRAGELVHASTAELPAAATTVTPSLTRAWTAVSTMVLAVPPRLRLATAGVPAWWCTATHSSAAMTSELKPDPAQSKTARE